MPAWSLARLQGVALEAWLRYYARRQRREAPALPEPTTVWIQPRRGAAFQEKGEEWDARVLQALKDTKPRAAAVLRRLTAEGIAVTGSCCCVRHSPRSQKRASIDLRVTVGKRKKAPAKTFAKNTQKLKTLPKPVPEPVPKPMSKTRRPAAWSR